MALTPLQRQIRRLRNEAGLTQEQLATRLRLKDKSTISHWELGDTSPRGRMIPKIAKVLGVSVSRLYDEAA